MSPRSRPGAERASVQAHLLVERLRKRNQRSERRGGVQLPDGEYAALEQELTRRLARRAA
jgi:hypothetical protein